MFQSSAKEIQAGTHRNYGGVQTVGLPELYVHRAQSSHIVLFGMALQFTRVLVEVGDRTTQRI